MLWWKSIVLSVPMSMMLMGSAQAETFVITRWTSMSLSLSQCIKEAKSALETGLFEENLDGSPRLGDGSGSVWGGRDDGQYKAVIKCLPDHGLVFFVVAGPNEGTVGKYVTNLERIWFGL